MLLLVIIAAPQAPPKSQGYCTLFPCSVIMKILLNICFENEMYTARYISTKVRKSLCTCRSVLCHKLSLQEIITPDQWLRGTKRAESRLPCCPACTYHWNIKIIWANNPVKAHVIFCHLSNLSYFRSTSAKKGAQPHSQEQKTFPVSHIIPTQLLTKPQP